MSDDASRSTLHHLNNLFQVIMGSLELLKRNRAAPAEAVDTALRATREASELAQLLLEQAYARASDPASSSAASSGTGLPKK